MENGTNLLAGRLAIFRINYKSDFILTLQSDAGWAIPFCIKFWTGVPSEAYYAGWDGTTYTNCAPVVGEPSKLQVQFDDHHLPIGELKYQIGYHFTVDDFPTTVEDEVINQASVIIDNDGIPMQVMLDFTGETAPEIQFSLPAYANEAQRIANEEQRIENEQQRIENEQTLVGNEETRIVHEWERQRNEQTRITQEEARERAFTQMQRDSESATSAANDAATLANQKAQLAQEKAEYAQQQGDFAKAQGETAQLDHTKAAGDHQTALADHQTAAADHQIAAADHQTAETDHTRADQDHTDVQNAIAAADLVYDISKAHASGGVLATYADLSAALGTNGSNVPVERRQGGMVVQFVRSSDNKYVQYRYMGTEITGTPFLDTANWQGVDEEPITGSDNLIKSGGVASTIATTEIVGKKKVYLTDFYGYTIKNGYSISTDGYIIEQPTSVDFRVVYTNNPVNKGAILHITGTPNSSSRFKVAISKVPITDENLTTVHLTTLSNEVYTSDIDLHLIVPFDGYIVWYRYVLNWTNLSLKACNISALQDNSVLDINELNNTGYASLADALVAVPTTLQKGGMAIRFINSSVNKYETYCLTSTTWSANESDWEGVENGTVYDAIVAEINSIVKPMFSNVIFPPASNYAIGKTSGVWIDMAIPAHYQIKIKPGSTIIISPNIDSSFSVIAFLKSINTIDIGNAPDYATGSGFTQITEETVFNAPDDAEYLYVHKFLLVPPYTDLTPEYIKIYSPDLNIYNQYNDITDKAYLSKVYPFGIGYTQKQWINALGFRGFCIPVDEIVSLKVRPFNANYTGVAFLSEFTENPTIGVVAPVIGNVHKIEALTELNVPRGTNYIWFNCYSNNNSEDLRNHYPLSLEVLKRSMFVKGGLAYDINYFEVDIMSTVLRNDWNSSQNQDNSTNKVGAALILPDTYKPYGKAIPIIGVFHGAQGYVTESVFGYNASNWNNLINKYLEAGYAVFDVDGYGTGVFDIDNNIAPSCWGCPKGVEAVKQAFEYIKANYNIESQMYIHGYSAGGCLAYSYPMIHPNDVKCVSQFEPSSPTNNAGQPSGDTWRNIIAKSYGYDSWSTAVSDNFSNFVGFSLPLSFLKISQDGAQLLGNDDLSHEIYDGFLVGHFPCPIRIWHGTAQEGGSYIDGEIVNLNLNKNVVDALRNGGTDASIRYVPNATHSDLQGATSINYIIEEELSFFKRF